MDRIRIHYQYKKLSWEQRIGLRGIRYFIRAMRAHQPGVAKQQTDFLNQVMAVRATHSGSASAAREKELKRIAAQLRKKMGFDKAKSWYKNALNLLGPSVYGLNHY